MLRAALHDADVRACDVSYVEAHGTGTKLGDPIETEASAHVYGNDRSPSHPLYVGSVKANLGHLEAGAGMAGLFAALATLHHRMAPPNCHLNCLNSKVLATVSDFPIVFGGWESSNAPALLDSLQVPTEEAGSASFSLKQKQDGKVAPIITAVSSFGYSGTIAHVLLQDYRKGVM